MFNLQIPSDHLYKFQFIGALSFIILSLALMISESHKYYDNLGELTKENLHVQHEREIFKIDSSLIINQNLDSNKLSLPKRPELITKKNIDKLNWKYKLNKAKNDINIDTYVKHKKLSIVVLLSFAILMGLSIMIIENSFGNWKKYIQIPQNEKMKIELASLKASELYIDNRAKMQFESDKVALDRNKKELEKMDVDLEVRKQELEKLIIDIEIRKVELEKLK